MILKAALIGVVIAATFGMGLFAMADIPDRINDISLDWGRGECMDEDRYERHGECEEHYDESEDSSDLRGSIHSGEEECDHLEGEEICEEHGEECEELEEEHCWEDDHGCFW